VSYIENEGDNFVRMAHTNYDNSGGTNQIKNNDVAIGKGMLLGVVNYARKDTEYKDIDWEMRNGKFCLKQREAFDVVVNFFVAHNEDVDAEDVTIFRPAAPDSANDIDARLMNVRVTPEEYILAGNNKKDLLTPEDPSAYAAAKDEYLEPVCAMATSQYCKNANGDSGGQNAICGACRFRFPKLTNNIATNACVDNQNDLLAKSFEAQWLSVHIHNEACGTSDLPYKELETWIGGSALTAFPGKLMLYPEPADDPFFGGDKVFETVPALRGNALYAASMQIDTIADKHFDFGFATEQVAALRLTNDDFPTNKGFVQLRGIERENVNIEYLLPQYPRHYPFGDGSSLSPPGTQGQEPSRCSSESGMTVPSANPDCDVAISEQKSIGGTLIENAFVFSVARTKDAITSNCVDVAKAVVHIADPYTDAEPEMSLMRRDPCPGSETHSSQCKALNSDGTPGTCFCASSKKCATDWTPSGLDALAYNHTLTTKDCSTDAQCGAFQSSCYTPNFGQVTAGWKMDKYEIPGISAKGECSILNRYYRTGTCVANEKLPCVKDSQCRGLPGTPSCSATTNHKYPSLYDSEVEGAINASSSSSAATGSAATTGRAQGTCRQATILECSKPGSAANCAQVGSGGECGPLKHYICHGIGVPGFATVVRNGETKDGGRCENDGSPCLQDSDCNYVFVNDAQNNLATAGLSDKSKYEPVAALCEWGKGKCNDGDVNGNDVQLLSLRILDDGVKAMSGRSFGMVRVSKPEAAHRFNLKADSTTALSLKENDL
jgi:hypothetical protein